MKYLDLVILILIFAFVSQINAQAKDDGWTKIGEKLVSFKADKDNVILTGNEREVSKFKIKCVQGAVKIKEISVKMSDGTKKAYNPSVGVLKNGMSTMIFDLPGKDNKLKGMELEYDSMGTIATNKRAKVEIWGKRKDS